MTKYATKSLLAAALVAAVGSGCQAGEDPIPASLDGPRAVAIARGEVCLPRADDLGALPKGKLLRCAEGQRGAIGLVVNERRDSVAVVDMSLRRPRVVNIDTASPGMGHIPVGQYPVDIATSRDGTVAYVLNGLDRTLSPINLWVLRAFETPIALPGTPLKIRVGGEAREQVIVALANPGQLWIRSAMRCDEPGQIDDRREHRPDEGCAFADDEQTLLPLDGNLADLDVSPDGRRAFVIYNDRPHASVFALEDSALQAFDGSCLDGRAQAPCEMARIDLSGPSSLQGFVALSVDPVGRFAYVVDRANAQVLVLDLTRHELIDATVAAEPPTYPLSTNPGIAVVRSPLQVTGDIGRAVIWQDDASNPTRAIVRYTFQALVAGDAGSVQQLETMTTFCELPASELMESTAFYEDHQAREASAEAACLFVPSFPMGDLFEPDPELAHRIFEQDGVRLAVNPQFQLRDGAANQGRLVGRATCQIPDSLQTALRQEIGPNDTVHCGLAALPQPVGLAVADNLTSYLEAPRADLLQAETVVFDGDNGDVTPRISRVPYDIRLLDEEWAVAYEGVLPATGRADRGVVDRDDPARFLAGGINLCTAGVQEGDHLIILTQPGSEAAAACAPYRSDRTDYLTYRVAEVSREAVTLEVLGGEFVDTLPSRACFNQGLRYEVRPVETWIVTGERSGYIHNRIADEDGQCVERPGAELGRTDARVRTGETYTGPYLQLRIRDGELEPVRGLRYTFNVERNFAASRFDTNTALPAQVLYVRDLPDGTFLIVPDMASDFVYMRNLGYPQDAGRAVR
jgi:hypothetical protein